MNEKVISVNVDEIHYGGVEINEGVISSHNTEHGTDYSIDTLTQDEIVDVVTGLNFNGMIYWDSSEFVKVEVVE